MPRNPRFDPLFEPVQIGPVTAPNRFYQVPHASGMVPHAMPNMRAGFRAVKAEGGWGVVCSGYCSIDPTGDDSPLPYGRLWSDEDIRGHAVMVDAVHEHGSLAGVELWHGGGTTMNRMTRTPPLSPSGVRWAPTHLHFMHNLHPRTMDLQDIRDVIEWQRQAGIRARRAGYDILYVYAGMSYLPQQFMLPEHNKRTDAYGGSMENRCRLARQMLEATREAAGPDCAVAIRISLELLSQRAGETAQTEAHEAIALLSECTDLFDVKMDFSHTDCGASRFSPEASHERVAAIAKQVTAKPVVGVGRFTSPDTMLGQIRRGVLDLIGAARPSIADPFLPRKIEEGREDEIRECIGCNICISSWHDCVPVRCTQNPSAGEEWRRGWHPEHLRTKGSEDKVLVVGAGPAGLECAMALGVRGYDVALAEAGTELGGRLLFEARLPGLSAWMRVRDYRVGRLGEMPNVETYLDSRLGAAEILEFGFDHVVTATGCRWTAALMDDSEMPTAPVDGPRVFTPSDIAAGRRPTGHVAVFDFDNYYMGGVMAEALALGGSSVTYITPTGHAGEWSVQSNEVVLVHKRLGQLGVTIRTLTRIGGVVAEGVTLTDVYSGVQEPLACDALLIVGQRVPEDNLFHDLAARQVDWADAGIKSVRAIGDAQAPGALVHAVYSGREYAETLDAPATNLRLRVDAPVS